MPALLAGQAQRPDSQILRDIAREIERYPRFTVFDDVSARVEEGRVTLTGRVTLPYKVEEIGLRVGGVEGVRSVRNELSVLPVSVLDEDLRYRTSRAIYRNPAFWHYASMPCPPIHIVVENGHVTLTGVVNSEGERVLARSLASSVGALSVTSRLRTDREARADIEKQ
jgi:osmotically-inducible protein OsmY